MKAGRAELATARSRQGATGRKRRVRKGPRRARKAAAATTEQRVADALAEARRGPLKVDSAFWGCPVFHSAAEDARAMEEASAAESAEARREAAEEARRERRREEDRLMKMDYFELVRLVDRFGACPGAVYCSSSLPGRAYGQYLARKATELELWWRRLRVRRLGAR